MAGSKSAAIGRKIGAVQRSLGSLSRALRALAPALRAAARRPVRKATAAKRRLRLTAKARAALRLQGRYMGYIRQLSGKQKAEVRALREKRGVAAAIRRAKEISKKKAA